MKGRLLYLPLLALLSLSPAALASSDREASAKNFFERVLRHQTDIWKSPFKKEHWRSPAPYFWIGISAASFSLDGDPSRSLRENNDLTCFNNFLASTPADITFSLIPAAVLAAGYVADHDEVTEYGWKLGEAALNSYLVILLIKTGTQRSRPHKGEVYGFWEGGNSFPSGHAAMAFSMAAVTSKHFSKHKWVPWVAFPLAGTVAFSRVSSGNHFASDVVTGGVIGFLIGHYIID